MNEPVSNRSLDLLRQLRADPAPAAEPNPIVLQAWQSISSELLGLIDHVEGDVDPVVKMLGALVGGFHGIEPEADTEMGDLFAVGAQQRARVDRLEQQVGELARAVAELTAAIRPPAGTDYRDLPESADLMSDTSDRNRRPAQLRRLTAAPVPSDSNLR